MFPGALSSDPKTLVPRLTSASQNRGAWAGAQSRIPETAESQRMDSNSLRSPKIIVGADLRVCPGLRGSAAPGQTRRSAPTLNRSILNLLSLANIFLFMFLL